MARGRYRRHSPQFRLQLCTDIRTGVMGRREAQRTYKLSANLIQTWLTQYDAGELTIQEVESAMMSEYEVKIGALERKVGQLTMEIDLLKKSPRLDPGESSDESLIVTGPIAVPSGGGAT